MYIITATFDPDAAFARVTELIALGHSPERLAERLDIPRDVEMVRQGVSGGSFKRMLHDLKELKHFVEIRQQIEDVRNGKSALRFLGSGIQEKQIAKLENECRKFTTLIDAPQWFYQQPRVQLLSAIRDYALDGSQQGDAVWTDVDREKLVFPIVAMFENANQDFGEMLVAQLERPLKDTDPRFLLEQFEGNRSITFDFDKGVATYYTPASAH
jgi:hypothetical protein